MDGARDRGTEVARGVLTAFDMEMCDLDRFRCGDIVECHFLCAHRFGLVTGPGLGISATLVAVIELGVSKLVGKLWS